MSISNILGFDGKLIPSVFPVVNPYPPGAAAGLGDVLAVSGNGGNPIGGAPQSMTNVGNISCANISAPFGAIQALDTSLIEDAGGLGNIGIIPNNNLSLLPQNNLIIKGAQTKGSMLVGDGTSTKELIVPVAPALPNGSVLILDSTTTLGVRWGGESGDINTITPGNNIDITGMSANPIVALKAPLTSTLNMGAVAITDSIGGVGTSGQVLTAGTGGQTLWGSNGVASITAGTNIGVAGTASVPIVSLLPTLTSTLGLGTQSITGTNGSMTLINAGSTATIQAVSTRVADTITSTTSSLLTKNSLVVNVSTPVANAITYGSLGISKTGVNSFSIQNASNSTILGGIGITLDPLSSVVFITQTALQPTKLRTNLTNHYYYPDYYADNQNTAGPIIVPYPQITNERMTLANYGVVQNNTWVEFGDTSSTNTAIVSMFEDSQGRVWTSQGNGTIDIRDANNTAPNLQTITLTGSLLNQAFCYYEAVGHMFIGGDFTTINGNGQLQYNLTRFDMSSFPYNFSPIFDTGQSIEGFNQPVFAISYSSPLDQLIVGGAFTSFLPAPTTVDYLAIISNPSGAPGSSSYSTGSFGGTNGSVNALYLDTAFNYLHVGGEYTLVNAGTQNIYYGGYYDLTNNTWFDVGGNTLNGNVMSIVITQYGTMFYAGSFTNAPQPYSCYIDRTNPSLVAPADTGLSGMSSFTFRNCVYGDGSNLAVLNNGVGVYVNQSGNFTTWIDNSNPTAFGASGDTSGLELWGGDYKVSYTGSTKLYDQVILPDSCSFLGGAGVFQYQGVPYQTFTINITDAAQQFVGNNTNGYWVPIGTPIGVFT